MAGILGDKGDNGAGLAKKTAEANQRRSLAELARQQAQADQGAAKPTGKKQGRGLLTFLNRPADAAGDQATFG